MQKPIVINFGVEYNIFIIFKEVIVKMSKKLKCFGITAGVITFVVCLIAGIWILQRSGFDTGDDALSTGIGLYFIGKAFFVGPMLIITTLNKKE